MKQIITYKLSVSRRFLRTHPRAGEYTFFQEKINNAIFPENRNPLFGTKIHTIRNNYDLWSKRMIKVQEGLAVIELFYWEGRPYQSKQVVFATLDKNSGCGVQNLIWSEDNSMNLRPRLYDSCKVLDETILAQNDGLSLDDFRAWFEGYNLSKPMAIIHFAKFRY